MPFLANLYKPYSIFTTEAQRHRGKTRNLIRVHLRTSDAFLQRHQSGMRMYIKQAAVFIQSIPVCHPGNVVGDGTGAL